VFLVANGFLPTRGSIVLDAIFIGMFLISAAMIISVCLVRFRKQYRVHRRLQIWLAVFLAVAVVVFEIDVRFITDWRKLAEPSRFYESGMVDRWLWIHLAFAIPTPFIWIFVVVKALRKFAPDAVPNDHSRSHRFWGWIAVASMLMTAITGCVFYWLAFAS
jgi:uncharacterized membrane protein YozB (DUF420 family)